MMKLKYSHWPERATWPFSAN